MIRTYQVERVRRLLARRAFEPAFDQLARALPELPYAIREHVRKTRGPLVRPPPPVVRHPTAFMSTPGDVAREAAALLWAARDARGALELLETQMERGDARALLQLAWMHAHAGRADLARLALSQFLRAAPALADEAEPLVARLDGRGGSL